MPITCGSPQPLKQHNQDGIHPFVSDPPPLPFFLSVWPELILLFIISFSKGISFFLSLIARFSQLFSDHPVPVGQLFPGAFLTPFKAECVCLSLSLSLSHQSLYWPRDSLASKSTTDHVTFRVTPIDFMLGHKLTMSASPIALPFVCSFSRQPRFT